MGKIRLTPDVAAILAACEQAGYAGGVAEYRFHPTRRWRFDLAFPALRVAFERDGGVWTGGRHTRGKGYERDCEKLNEAAIAGWCVVRASPGMIASGLALTQLLAALEARSCAR